MITETENHLPSQQGAEDGLMILLHSRSLILSTAVTVVLVGDTLFFDVVYQFYAVLLDRSGSGDVFVRLGRTLIHREGNVRGQVRMRSYSGIVVIT